MDASKKRVFYYHADAAPIGGHFTKPEEKIVHSHGSSSLAQAGGHVTSRVSAFKLDELVSFDHAYSEIHGTVTKNGSWMTQVTSVVEGLNVLGVVKADRVIAVLSVEHPCNGGPTGLKRDFVGYNPKEHADGRGTFNVPWWTSFRGRSREVPLGT